MTSDFFFLAVTEMDRKIKKALAMGAVAFFLTRDFRTVVVMALASYAVDYVL